MLKKLFFLLLITSFVSCSQTKTFDCEKILDTEPYFARHGVSTGQDSLQHDFEVLGTCGGFDEIDREMLNGPFIGTILVQFSGTSKKITYREVLSSITKFKLTKSYQDFREIMKVSKTLEAKIANPKDWEADKHLFIKMGMSETELQGLYDYIVKNEADHYTYKQAFQNYSKTLPPKESKNEKLEFKELANLEEAMQKAKESKKKILIYFSGYACVNCRKVDEKVLSDPEIKNMITQHLEYYIAYVDSRKPSEDPAVTIGKKHMILQMEKFNTAMQPYFVITDVNGNKLAEHGYTVDKEEFMNFLNKTVN